MHVFVLAPEQIGHEPNAHQQACYEEILKCAAEDVNGKHHVTQDPEKADLILAPIQGGGFGHFFAALRQSRFFKTHKAKIVCYCPDDLVYPSIPGIYPSVAPHWARCGWACGGHYVSSHIRKHHFEPAAPKSGRAILFSFVGSSKTHPIRERILQLKHPRAVLDDSTPKSNEGYWYQQDREVVEAMFSRFRQILSCTKFALCPRGIASSSIRLFEALEAGCVPIIISDGLVLPPGPQWPSFSVCVLEKNIASIPLVVERLEPRFELMSQLARAAWEQHFSRRSTFHQVAEWGAGLIQGLSAKKRSLLEVLVRVGEYVAPQNIRLHLRHALGRG